MRDRIRSLAGLVRSVFRRGIGQQVGWMVGGSGLQAGVAFAANLALVRLLTPEDFGRFAIVQANVSLVGALFNLRIGPLILQTPESELDDDRLGVYLSAVGLENLLVGAGALAAFWIANLLSLEAGLLLVASLASTWVTAEVNLYERQFDYRSISVLETAAQVGSQVLAVVGAVAGMGAIVLYARKAVVVVIMVLGLASLGALETVPLKWPSRAEWRDLLERVRGFWADGLLERGFDRVVVILLGFVAGETVTGYFHQAHRLAVAPNRLMKPISDRIVFNLFSHHVEEERKDGLLIQSLVLLGGALLLAGGVATAVADPLIPWLFGPGWGPVVPLFIALVGVIVGMPLFNVVQSYFMSGNWMRPFLVLARGTQYTVLAAATAVALVGGNQVGLILSIGVSVAYVLATLVPAGWVAARGEGGGER